MYSYTELFAIGNLIDFAEFNLAEQNNPRHSYWTRFKPEVKFHLNAYAGVHKYISTKQLFL